jgi:hypothetical protein
MLSFFFHIIKLINLVLIEVRIILVSIAGSGDSSRSTTSRSFWLLELETVRLLFRMQLIHQTLLRHLAWLTNLKRLGNLDACMAFQILQQLGLATTVQHSLFHAAYKPGHRINENNRLEFLIIENVVESVQMKSAFVSWYFVD